MNRLLLVLLLFLCPVLPACSGPIFKCQAYGDTTYQQVPCGVQAPPVKRPVPKEIDWTWVNLQEYRHVYGVLPPVYVGRRHWHHRPHYGYPPDRHWGHIAPQPQVVIVVVPR